MELYAWMHEDTQCCRRCMHFIRHYVRIPDKRLLYMECFEGHCVYPRLKARKATDCCDHFHRNENPDD